MSLAIMKRLLIICIFSLGLFALVGLQPARVSAAPLLQTSCTLPATVTTATQLTNCITAANTNGAGLDTITLGANITLSAALPQITTAITIEGAGYTLNGNNSVRIFDVTSSGNLTVKYATLQNGFISGSGGAIQANGTVTLIGNTFLGNSATNGGAVSGSSNTVTAINNTFSGNAASNGGGAIYSIGPVVLTNNTFVDNSAPNGDSIRNFINTFYMAGNILADATNGAHCQINGTLSSNGYNFADDTSCGFSGTSQNNATLNLGSLADNGGYTDTYLPGAGSAAIGAIPYGTTINNNGIAWRCHDSTLYADQRGESRPFNSGTACTAGSVEVPTASTSLTIIKDASPAIGTDFDFTINSAPLTSYSGTTTGNPFWTRPNEGTPCTLSANSVRYHVQAFVVDTSGIYNMLSIQNYNGYLHLYQDSFNPLDQCANYLYGDNDSGLSGNTQSEVITTLEAGRVYYLVTSGFASASTGNFTNSFSGAGTVYTLYESFSLDDAVPDDSDGVNASITYAVPSGTYSVSELLTDSAWGLDSATCTGASGGFSLTDETLSVAVASGETVSCTFTNVTTVDCGNIMSESDLSFCIAGANANGAGLDTLTLGADINLTAALPQITSEVTLEGANHFIDGGDSVQLFYVTASGDFTVNQATLQNGSASEGGGIFNRGLLTLADSIVSENSALAGGGIFNGLNGTLTMTNSTFSSNSALDGGGIYSRGPLTMTNSTFSSNSADLGDGGGIHVENSPLTVNNSTFSGNSARVGGGIFNDGTLTMSNSTFSGNSANGGGIFNSFNSDAHLAGTIFASGLSGDNCVNTGTLNDTGYNLSDDASCGFSGTSADNATLNLSALSVTTTPGQQVHTPQTGSDAIGVIPNGTTVNNNGVTLACNQTTTDQLGADRPINSGDACTAGAVEVEPPLCPSWTVTTAAELSSCITLANNNESPSPTADTITLGADIDLTTLPASPLPQITTEIMLEGDGYTIDGGDSMRIFDVGPGGDLTVNNATLQNGSAPPDEYGDSSGGGIYNNGGSLTVSNSTLANNSASDGGGIYTQNGSLTVISSTISGNSATAYGGGGITVSNAPALISSSTFSGNSAIGWGGGLYAGTNTLVITNSVFSDNSAGNGGGIFNESTNASIANSTFSGNSVASTGGGIHNGGLATLTVTTSTFSDNQANDNGGGIYNEGTLTVSSGTFSGNSGSGLYNSFGTAHLAGNVFAAGSGGDNCTSIGTLTDNGYNLSDDASCGFSGTGSANNATLNLSALSVTTTPGQQVHTPQLGSDAIGVIPYGTTINNNGITLACNQTTTDQLGADRPLNSGDACTAGAVEVTPICTSWTVTTAVELSECITLANANESPSPTADTITLGADITLTTALPQITSEITLEGAGYTVDGGGSVRIFTINLFGDFTVNQATLQNGSATNGGGINNNGTLTVTNSIISGNSATNYGGGINNFGTLMVTNSTFADNEATLSGGGINFGSGTLTALNSTFSGNTANYGGGIYNLGTLNVTNSTFADNEATISGGGIYNLSTLHLAGTIFAAGLNGDNCVNSGGTFNDNGYNLSDDASCGFSGTSADNATLNLGALADNGGDTQTHLPGVGSDAIGAIPNGTTISNNGTSWTCDQSATDQRGELRPLNSGDACTVGAVEVVIPVCTSWTVTTAAELSACIVLANNNESPSPTADTITLGADITLTSALPEITTAITLEGAGYTVDGGDSVQLFSVALTGDFTVNQATLQNGYGDYGGGISNDGTLTVTNSSFSDNSALFLGGGISNDGTLTVSNSTFSGNYAAGDGGGISNYGTLTVTNSIFSDNSALVLGSGISNNTGTLTVSNSTISGNYGSQIGGGISNYAGTVEVLNSTISDNLTNGDSGGIRNSRGTLTVSNSTISGNSSPYDGGGISNYEGTVEVLNSTILGNSTEYGGGGISNSDGTLNVTNSTISGNSTTYDGGGILNYGTLNVTNSTISGNSTTYDGGGIFNNGTVTVTNSTISGNSATSGGGIVNYTALTVTSSTFSGNIGGGLINVDATAHLAGNIFAAGLNGNNCVNSGGTFNDNGYNLSDDASCGFSGFGSANNATLNLGALADNGGDTQTHLPGVGSDAIGAIPNGTTISNNGTDWTCDQSATDQRGELRPINSGDACTAGAVEVEPPAQNVAPVANDDSATTDEDTAVTIDVLANDSDSDGDSLTVESVTDPTNGSVVNNGTDVTYTPDANFSGSDSFSYTVSDGNGGSDTATVTITVNAVNNAPVAVDDSATTDENTAVTIDVLANDSDVDGDSLTVESVTAPTNGSVVNNGTDVTYTPDANFSGSDSFSYTVSDGNGGSDTATVTITVNAVNNAPVAVDDSATTDENTAVTINVLANDSDSDGDSLTVESVTDPTNGSVVNNGTDVTYTPDANFSGSDSFSYTVSDGNGGSDTATVTITVNAVNNAPVAVDDSATTDENTAVTIDVLANDSDVDGDSLTVESVTAPTNGSVVNNGTDVTYTPNAGFNGSDSFTYVVSDGLGGTDSATVTITVSSVNFLPIVLSDVAATNEDVSVTVDVLANDSDPDNDPLQIESATTPSNGVASIVNNTIVYTPTLNFNGVDSFSYTVNDGNGGSGTATVEIRVTAVNDAPVAVDDNVVTNEDTAVTVDVLANDSDVDGDALTIDSVSAPASGTVVHNGSDLTYTPNAGFVGSDSFTYTVTDGNGGIATATVTIIVNEVVQAGADLSISKDGPANSVDQESLFTYTIVVTNHGPDLATGVTVTDLLPEEVEFEAVSSSQGICTETDDEVLCALGELAVGSQATITLTVMAEESGDITNSATVSGNEADADLTNNEDTAVVTVIEAFYCNGIPATIVGTMGDDIIRGTSGNDVIVALGGNDTIIGLGGDDIICGGKGDDVIKGGSGHDFIKGGPGADMIEGNKGHDELRGGRGNDTIEGGDGNDILMGGRGDDWLDGGSGQDILIGGRGNDVLLGGIAADELYGGPGNDTLEGNLGNDYCHGGNGTDTAISCETEVDIP